MSEFKAIQQYLGEKAGYYLEHQSKTVSKERLHLPSPDFVSREFGSSDRSPQVLRSLQDLYSHGRLAGTGYLSILPVDQGIEHSAGASFAKNPDYFDPENIVKLAIEGGCNAVCSTYGVLGNVARKYAHKIPFMVKFNHNELLTYPNKAEQITWGTVKQCWDMGCTAVGATVYFGSDDATRQIVEVSKLFQQAHELGMATVLWCYTRNKAPDRPVPLSGAQLLFREDRPDQQRRRLGRERLRRGGDDGGRQQARRRLRPHQRAQGVPAPDRRRRQAPADDPGRVPGARSHDRLSGRAGERLQGAGRRQISRE